MEVMMRIVLLVVCMVWVVGCATKEKAPTVVPAKEAVPSSEMVPTADEAIGKEVRYRLATQCPEDAMTIAIMVNDGVVTLRGSVLSQTSAWRAQAAAAAVPGVKTVRNELLVRRR